MSSSHNNTLSNHETIFSFILHTQGFIKRNLEPQRTHSNVKTNLNAWHYANKPSTLTYQTKSKCLASSLQTEPRRVL